MDVKREIIGLRIFTGSFLAEVEKIFGTATIKAILNRLGQKPAEIVAEHMLEKYEKTVKKPFENIGAVYTIFENTITQLYDSEIISQEDFEDKFIIRIKNVCAFRHSIRVRDDLSYGGTLCEFTIGYFETALKMLTGLKVEYQYLKKESTDDHCVIDLVFWKKKKPEEILEIKEPSESEELSKIEDSTESKDLNEANKINNKNES
ncbi:hypothetical protein DSAG12_02734 [Promethearchaeum syntrophicum]|uniref:V4R domain protein n=1 Tax=Promethearchaeum syntrophicum TaxID=2594042 RepID=A0A5B9DCL9_9ARCH|nr:hypothetical protein [Candidatus Prometheoarchaeum syntrophicum]QEE16904.1 hypothetical protein DSAG12_02734 [Candidatus Prometheoarchaeum syntrophicum]